MKGFVLITGASSGIGLELARVFAGNRHDLVIVSRDLAALKKVKSELERDYKVSVIAIAKDLSLKKSCDEVYSEVKRRGISVDVLVNNAGFGTFGKFRDTDLETELSMIGLNISALTHLTKLFARDMIKKRRGKILNLASTAAFFPGPMMAVYYATKAYVLSFSTALNEELRGTGVSVTALCPGPTKSGFQKAAHIETDHLFNSRIPTSEEVARFGYTELMKGRLIAVHGLKNRALIQVAKFLPRRLVASLVRRIQE